MSGRVEPPPSEGLSPQCQAIRRRFARGRTIRLVPATIAEPRGLRDLAALSRSEMSATVVEAAGRADDFARVINIGSIDGMHVSGIETYSYAASKAGASPHADDGQIPCEEAHRRERHRAGFFPRR